MICHGDDVFMTGRISRTHKLRACLLRAFVYAFLARCTYKSSVFRPAQLTKRVPGLKPPIRASVFRSSGVPHYITTLEVILQLLSLLKFMQNLF
jgi:hypothetical protein